MFTGLTLGRRGIVWSKDLLGGNDLGFTKRSWYSTNSTSSRANSCTCQVVVDDWLPGLESPSSPICSCSVASIKNSYATWDTFFLNSCCNFFPLISLHIPTSMFPCNTTLLPSFSRVTSISLKSKLIGLTPFVQSILRTI